MADRSINILAEYLAQFFPGRFGIGVRQPMGRTFRRMLNQGERPKVVVGHSYVDRIGRADEPEEGDPVQVNWHGFAGASMPQLLTIVYKMIDGEYKYFSSQFVVIGWENSVMNGLTLEEAEAIINGVVEEQRGLTTHKIVLAECLMSPRIIKYGKSQVAFRINRMVKEANRKIGAHKLDLERSVGKVDARKEVVGVKPNMWAERGHEGYHPSDVGAGRMATWIRNFFRHGMDAAVPTPSYPPRKSKEDSSASGASSSTPKPDVAAPERGEKKKLTRKELLEALKRARSGSKSSEEDRTPAAKRRNEECLMDTDEELEVDRRVRRVLEPEGEDLPGPLNEVPDLITIDEDPMEGSSRMCMVPEVVHTGASCGSVASSGATAWKQVGSPEEEEDMATLESYFDGTRGLVRGINALRGKLESASSSKKKKELHADLARKRVRLTKHLASLAQVALEAAHVSAALPSSSSSSSTSSSEEEEERKPKPEVVKAKAKKAGKKGKKETSYADEARRLAKTLNAFAKARKEEKAEADVPGADAPEADAPEADAPNEEQKE